MCGYRKNLTHLQAVLLSKDSRDGAPGTRKVWRNLLVISRAMAVLGGIGLLVAGCLSQARAAGNATLAWDPSISPGVSGYRLYYGTSSGNHQNILNVGNTTKATVTGLTPGQTYYFVVTAYNSVGLESLPSNQVSFAIGNGQANLVWENKTTGEHTIWIMQNGAPSYSVALPTIPIEWHIAAAADFLGTGQADLVWENTITGERSIWILKSGVLSSIISLPTIPIQWHIAAAADFLGTGQAGLVWENTTTGERGIWVMQNGVPAYTINLPTIPTQWSIAGAADE